MTKYAAYESFTRFILHRAYEEGEIDETTKNRLLERTARAREMAESYAKLKDGEFFNARTP